MKKSYLFIATIGALLTSCGGSGSSGSSEPSIQYYPVQEDANKKWSLLGTDGEILISEEYKNQPSPVINGLYYVQNENGSYTVYEASKKPKEILEDLVDVGYLNDGVMPIVRKSERISVIDKTGKTVFSLEPVGGKEVVNSRSYFHDGMLVAQNEENNFGAFNTKGEKIYDFKYKAFNDFNDGVAVVEKAVGENEVKTLIVDTKGNELDDIKIKEGYSLVKNKFIDGFLAVKDKEGSFRFIDKKGEELKLPGKVQGIDNWNNKYFVFKGDDGWGVMTLNEAAEVVIKAKYSSVQILPDNKFYAVDNKDHYILNEKGDKELELSDDYQSYTLTPNAKFKYIAKEKNHYILLDEQGKPINKLELAEIITNLKDDLINSNYFDVAGMVQNLTANITDKGIGNYYIGEAAADLGLNPDDYRYSSSFKNEELDSKGYKYIIVFNGYTNNSITVYEYDFITSTTNYLINPEAKVSKLSICAICEQNCWQEAKAKVFEALKAKGYKAEAEGEASGLFTKGNVLATVDGNSRSITITLTENDPEVLPMLIERVKSQKAPSASTSNNWDNDDDSDSQSYVPMNNVTYGDTDDDDW